MDLHRRTITLISTRTKTSQTRRVPITSRLKAVLEMRQDDPEGEPFGGDHFVFGNELGEQVGTIKTAWKATCRRAKITGLVFHDLRREFGSRLIETPGVHPALVRDWLGHANITTTSRYLTTSAAGLQQAAKHFELNRGFAHHSHNEEESELTSTEVLSPEVIDAIGIEEVSRDGIEPSTRRLRERMAAVRGFPPRVLAST